MSIEENKSLAREILKFPNTGDFSEMDERVSEDFVYRSANGEEHHGRDGFKELISKYRSAFPDLEFKPNEVIAEGDTVVMLQTTRGTHRGQLMDIPASGNEVTLPIMSRLKFRDGKLVDLYESFDSMDMMRQIGVLGKGAASSMPPRESRRGEGRPRV